MRLLAALLATLSILLSATSVLAQPGLGSTRVARVVGAAGLAVVDTVWSEQAGRRSTRVTATLGSGPALELHDGTTVRTAIAASPDALLVVAFHGGDRPFARALLADVRDGALARGRTTELPIPRSAQAGAMRPSAAVAAPTQHGFTILLQETDSQGAAAAVRTTMFVLGRDGALISAREVAVPWALGALAWNGQGYHLAVLWGGWTAAHAGTARICLVTLSPEGAPQQHPWWATPFDAIGEMMLLPRADGAMQLVWRSGDGRTIRLQDASMVLGWGVEPPAPTELARIDPDAPLAPVARGATIALATP